MNETGTETLYVTSINQPVANIGVAVEAATGLVHPWFLGSPNERDVQGYAGTPVSVNELTFDFGIDIGAAGASFPKVQRFYVSVDSGSDEFTHRSLPGAYVLRSWVNDVRPPQDQGARRNASPQGDRRSWRTSSTRAQASILCRS